jgi:hypothetical protein
MFTGNQVKVIKVMQDMYHAKRAILDSLLMLKRLKDWR